MTRKEQKKFIRDLMNNMKRGIIDKIDGKQIPKNWTGKDLRLYIAEVADRQVIPSLHDRVQKTAYKNDVIIHNL